MLETQKERERHGERVSVLHCETLLVSTVPETLAASNCISPNIPGLLLVRRGNKITTKSLTSGFAFSGSRSHRLAGRLARRLPLVGQATRESVINDP